MLTEKERQQILANLLALVRDISDKAYQIRVWIEARGPECQDYDEVVNNLFDEADGIIAAYQDFGLSEKQCKTLREFREAFENFNDEDRPYLEKDFIDTPEWAEIINMAKDVLKAFNYSNDQT